MVQQEDYTPAERASMTSGCNMRIGPGEKGNHGAQDPPLSPSSSRRSVIASPMSPPIASFDLRPEDLFPSSSPASLFGPVESILFRRPESLVNEEPDGTSRTHAGWNNPLPFSQSGTDTRNGFDSYFYSGRDRRSGTGRSTCSSGSLSISSPHRKDSLPLLEPERRTSWPLETLYSNESDEHPPGLPSKSSGYYNRVRSNSSLRRSDPGLKVSSPVAISDSSSASGTAATPHQMSFARQIGKHCSGILNPLLQRKLAKGPQTNVRILEYGSRSLDHSIIAEVILVIGGVFAAPTADGIPLEPFFEVMHQKDLGADFCPLQDWLTNGSHSYQRQETYAELGMELGNGMPPNLKQVFTKLIPSSFTRLATIPASVDVGLSVFDLHWLHTYHEPGRKILDPVYAAKLEFQLWLQSRAVELRKDGLLLMIFAVQGHARDKAKAAGTHKTAANIFEQVAEALTPCLNRLVSTGLLTGSMASKMTDVPIHTRDQDEIEDWMAQATLHESWQVEHAEHPVLFEHPASVRLREGTISAMDYSDEVLKFIQLLYEPFFRRVLTEARAAGSGNGRQSDEVALASLWDVLAEKVEKGAFLQTLSAHFAFFVLRRR